MWWRFSRLHEETLNTSSGRHEEDAVQPCWEAEESLASRKRRH